MTRSIFGKTHFIRNAVLFCLSVGFFSVGVFALWAGSLKMPDLKSFEERKVVNSTKIYDRTGKVLLYDVHDNIKRTVIPFADMGSNIKNATVAIEDRDFYQHGGIRLTSIIRAIAANIGSGGFSQGGSTITQQVIKNALLTQDKKVSRKIKEWVLALKLEREASKEDILALYLNESPYGGNIYGVSEASSYFFNKAPKDLTLAEAAYLAALPQAPSYYSPYGTHLESLEARKNLVLDRMKSLNFIGEAEYAAAKAERVNFTARTDGNAKALHFVMYVRAYLEERYGQNALDRGLRIVTTLDYDLQKKAEDIVRSYAMENVKKFNASNAGLVAIDPKTGQILAMVGSRDYFDKEIDGNFNITTAHRQPGSSFKPVVYATAFMKGYTPETVLFDLPTEFQTTCAPDGKPLPGASADDCYMPVNYDDKYRGPMSLREALAQSINIPAIKVLYLAGIDASLSTARSLGITSLKDRDQYGLTLVLGGGEVSLLDLTGAYAAFANSGVRNPHAAILSVEDVNGKRLETWQPRPEQAIPKEIALQVSDILSDNVARGSSYGDTFIFPGRQVAAKTGTTNDYRDAWVLGYTPSVTVGVWAGNNDNSPMQKKVAGLIVAPMWKAFMKEAVAVSAPEFFEKPRKNMDPNLKPVLRGIWWGGVEQQLVPALGTPAVVTQQPSPSVPQSVHSILYWVDKRDPLGPPPANPASDPQFNLWEYPIQRWVAQQPSLPGLVAPVAPGTPTLFGI